MSRGLGLAGAVAILLGLAALILPGQLGREQRDTPRPVHPPAALSIGAPAGPSITIGPNPIGLSIEYPLLARELGSGRCPPAAFVRTLAALGSPTLRIGGDSQDQVAPSGSAARPGVSNLGPDFWTQLKCLERQTRIPVVVGLNLASGAPASATALAADARAAVPPARLSFELGNEPDIYGTPVKWWNGHALVASAMPWSTYLARARALKAALGPGSSLEGPDFASGRWVAAVPALAHTLALRTIDAHFYPLDGCSDPAAATRAALLSRRIQIKLDERVRLARDARAAGLAAAVSETNSISCGGVAGVSDQPAAAVWAVRMIVQALRDGFDSVRFHSSGGAYDPFVVAGAEVAVRPLYVGLRAAAGLLTPGAALRAIPNAAALDGVAITVDGVRTIVLSNYSPRARWVTLHAAAPVRVLAVIAQTPTVLRSVVAPAGAGVRVELPPNSVDAITVAPGA